MHRSFLPDLGSPIPDELQALKPIDALELMSGWMFNDLPEACQQLMPIEPVYHVETGTVTLHCHQHGKCQLIEVDTSQYALPAYAAAEGDPVLQLLAIGNIKALAILYLWRNLGCPAGYPDAASPMEP